MPGIICPIRGGHYSNPTINKAIELAEETSLPLCFLYVVNLDFLSRTASSRIQVISEELHEMGDFILLTAQTKADLKGVVAEGVVRQGNVEDEIITQCKEFKADYVVLGQPQGQAEEVVFTHDRFSQFKQRIEELGVRVVLPVERVEE